MAIWYRFNQVSTLTQQIAGLSTEIAPEKTDENVLLCGDGGILCPQLTVSHDTIRSALMKAWYTLLTTRSKSLKNS